MKRISPDQGHARLSCILAAWAGFLSIGWAGSADSRGGEGSRLAADSSAYYASPNGGGDGRSSSSPFTIQDFWNVAAPGATLFLLDGEYYTNIDPPDALDGGPVVAGAAGAPVTLKAFNDGQVLIDARFGSNTIHLRQGNDWFVIEGINARNGSEYVYRINGANHVILRRVGGWDVSESGSNIFRTSGEDILLEDAFGFGRARKILTGAQYMNSNTDPRITWRRCFTLWNAKPPANVSQGSSSLEIGYRTRGIRAENMIATWNTDPGTTVSAVGVVRAFYHQDSNPPDGHRRTGNSLLGSIAYLPPGARFAANNRLLDAGEMDEFLVKDSVFYAASDLATTRPMNLSNNLSNPSGAGLRVEDCVGVAPQPSSIGTRWTLTNYREGTSIAEAIGTEQTLAQAVPGIRSRYVNGVRTGDPLWPWPMNQRIIDAMVKAGRTPVDVTAELEALLGPLGGDSGTGPIAHWTFDDGSGTTATDLSPHANHGSLTGGPGWTLGPSGGALAFSGATQYVQVGDPSNGSLDFADGQDLTLAGWFSRSAYDQRHPILFKKRGTAASQDGYAVEIKASGELGAWFSDGIDTFSVATTRRFQDATWRHFAVVLDESDASATGLYIDGVLETGTASGSLAALGSLANVHALRIGCESDGDIYFQGVLDDIRIYNRALGAAEVAALASAGNRPPKVQSPAWAEPNPAGLR